MTVLGNRRSCLRVGDTNWYPETMSCQEKKNSNRCSNIFSLEREQFKEERGHSEDFNEFQHDENVEDHKEEIKRRFLDLKCNKIRMRGNAWNMENNRLCSTNITTE